MVGPTSFKAALVNKSKNEPIAAPSGPFFGHPAGLGWLSGSEFWERFSYYGMQALLVLYMTHSLLQPAHVGHVLGFEPFRSFLQSIYGPLSPDALASVIFGLYAGLVYVTPILGGLLADRLLGRTATVTIGASLMALGHFLMAFDVSFLIALLCLLLGSGCFKGNIATQVGDLYGADDPRRADAFQIYMLGIQLAVIGSPLVCGTLGEVYGWHWGFGAAGVGMLIGLTIYLIGRPNFPPERARMKKDDAASRRPAVAPGEWRNLIILLALLPVLALSLVGNNQIFNAYLVWAERSYQLVVFGAKMPVTWILSFGSVISAAMIAFSATFWRWWGKHWAEPDELSKIAIGVTIAAAAPLFLVAASLIFASSGHRVSLGWAVVFEIVNDLGFANVLPVGLALYSRASPKGFEGAMIGIYYLHLFAANMLVGWLGGLLDQMQPSAFWLLHAALIAIAAAVLIVVRLSFGRSLAPAYKAPELAQQSAA